MYGKIQVKVFWAVMQCSVVVGYQHYQRSSWRWKQHETLKCWCPTTTQHNTTQHYTVS